jgi:multisubunit Na+/H+ antiporter MnhC subunit
VADRALFLVLVVINVLCVGGMFAIQYAILRVRRERQQSVRRPVAVALVLGAVGLAAAVGMFFLALRS